MDIVNVKTKTHNYDVNIGNGLLSESLIKMVRLDGIKKVLVVTDTNVDPLYSEDLMKSIDASGLDIFKFVVKDGERSKSIPVYEELLNYAAKCKISRSDIFVALGGGIVGDLTGFAAATYLRGVDFVQIPTTLLSAVDSSVGGKVGINLNSGKNLAGAFQQPRSVICDTNTLSTLTHDVYKDGIAEVIKYGVIKDSDLFNKTESRTIKSNIDSIIKRCVQIKADIVERDEFDKGERQLLNFGHTVGHAVEKLSDYEISHGKAVSIGMATITRAAVKMNLCNSDVLNSLIRKLESFTLPIDCPFEANQLFDLITSDKKVSENSITLVIPKDIGDSVLYNIDLNKLENLIELGVEE